MGDGSLFHTGCVGDWSLLHTGCVGDGSLFHTGCVGDWSLLHTGCVGDWSLFHSRSIEGWLTGSIRGRLFHHYGVGCRFRFNHGVRSRFLFYSRVRFCRPMLCCVMPELAVLFLLWLLTFIPLHFDGRLKNGVWLLFAGRGRAPHQNLRMPLDCDDGLFHLDVVLVCSDRHDRLLSDGHQCLLFILWVFPHDA